MEKPKQFETIEIDDEQETSAIEQALIAREKMAMEMNSMRSEIEVMATDTIYPICGRRRSSTAEKAERITGRYRVFAIEEAPFPKKTRCSPDIKPYCKSDNWRTWSRFGKFIVIEGEDQTPIMRCYDNAATHNEIVEDLKTRTGLEGRILGGGSYYYDDWVGKYYCFNAPCEYGTAPSHIVTRSIETAARMAKYQRWRFTVDMENRGYSTDIVGSDLARSMVWEKEFCKAWNGAIRAHEGYAEKQRKADRPLMERYIDVFCRG
ncbi:MAG: hypothetical protein KKD17_03110 [Nanoarchaeota archaeon]|nr:hypothetical protein [Nanoarchaeota archaeon]